ncbi:TonB family protein [Dyadobacter sp. BE34]|uniref:TonB family protein n=1 Tax=Dyadobacter fermentans TaxID=94254 RepID=A0ABU1R0D9_9BACT|nr:MULTISPECIES: M56 family metallopeptidase [Dyadobacter]MDR6806877.1 TonB family protein [Dyadobacter fermentans]MDR7044619.1 TonB family protein [Dyadobacter sp. BE242]MDR7198929.1 TonB family protein [Dyadobacter sp. BE34]MDR7216891.1 TonB family protein [Dyadobacter sp. BE31]MDR7263583.1 TonB family protein [Dyadobacter sp. BE32]
MEALPYLLKVNICWAVFYGCYWALFRKHTFFMLNRFYLLFSLLISFAIPAIELHETVAVAEIATTVTPTVDSIIVAPARSGVDSTRYLLLTCYGAAVIAMLIGLIRSLWQIHSIIRGGISVPMEGYHLVISQRRHSRSGSFSFLKWMIISNEDYERNFEPIFMHEMVHVRQWHTLDILLIELLKALFWFNPALWLYKRALQDTHEYLADEQALDKDRYATFLVAYAKNAVVTSVTNQFFNSSLLKRRIHMMYQNRTAAWLRSKYLLLCPLLALAIALMAARKYVYEERNDTPQNAEALDSVATTGNAADESGAPVPDSAAVSSGNEPVLAKKDSPAANQMAAPDERRRILLDRWPGPPYGKSKFLANTLKYPKQAFLDGVEGQVSVSFLIDTDGNISDPKIEKGVRKDLDNEAMRVVRLMPKWTPAQKNNAPVAVRYTMNIAFSIAVDTLPLAVKEKTPDFWGNRSVYSPAPTAPLGTKRLKEFFEGPKVDLRDSVPPTTVLRKMGITRYRPLPEQPVDSKIK